MSSKRPHHGVSSTGQGLGDNLAQEVDPMRSSLQDPVGGRSPEPNRQELTA